MKLYSVVVTYNGSRWVEKCFGSLANAEIQDHTILAIDNCSSDNTVDKIRDNFPSVKVIETGENLGFGKANNIGMKMALDNNADFVLLLNQDAWLEQDTLAKLISCMKLHPEIGIISPVQRNADRKVDLSYLRYKNKFSIGEIDTNILDVTFVNAAAWLVSKACLNQVGGFSPIFFMYGEDNNFINRTLFHGYKISICEEVSFVHDRTFRDIYQFDRKRLNLYIYHVFLSHLTNVRISIFNGFCKIILFCLIKIVVRFSLSRIPFLMRFISISVKNLAKLIFNLRVVRKVRSQSIKSQAFLHE